MTEQSLPEFARRIEREHGAAARAAEVGLRALHAELVEQRSPERAITSRAHWADVQREFGEPEAGI